MSRVAHRAFAPVPLEPNFDGLTRRLIALRAEIDAILAELSDPAIEMLRAEAGTPGPVPFTLPAAEPAATTVEEALPILTDARPDAGLGCKGWDNIEETEAFFEPISEQPIADRSEAEPIDVGLEALDCAAPTTEDLPIAAVDTDPAEHTDATDLLTEAELSPATDAPLSANIEPAIQPADAAIPEASLAPSSEASEIEAPRQEPTAPVDTVAEAPRADDSIPAPAAGADPPPAMATVISLQPRQRKDKGGLSPAAPVSMPARRGRHIAAKIAASILVVLTTISALVLADRTALGSVQALPWMSPTPSGPTGIDWLLQRLKSSIEAAEKADLPLDDGPFAGRAD